MRRLYFISILLSFFYLENLHGQSAGSIDSTFGVGGLARSDTAHYLGYDGDMLIQPDGKILVLGERTTHSYSHNSIVLMRMDSSGVLDAGFGSGGEVNLNTASSMEPFTLCLLASGKILIGGYFSDHYEIHSFIVRLNEDGSLDSSFGTNAWAYVPVPGFTSTSVNVLAELPDGRILACGSGLPSNSTAVFRLKPNGIIDSTFGTAGYAFIPGFPAVDMKRAANGEIYLAGRILQGTLVRLDSNGIIDSSFGINGIAQYNIGGAGSSFRQVYPLSDGKILCTGDVYTNTPQEVQYLVSRFNEDGSLDPSYGTNGNSITNFWTFDIQTPRASLLQNDESIVFTGRVDVGDIELMLIHFTPSGLLDLNFGNNGVSIYGWGLGNGTDPFAAIAQSPQKFLVAVNNGKDTTYAMIVARFYSSVATGVKEVPGGNITGLLISESNCNTLLKFSLETDDAISINVLDATGRNMLNLINTQRMRAGNNELPVDLCSLPSGIYLITVQGNHTLASVKWINAP